MDKAIKFDNEKPRLELLPPQSLIEIAEVFTFGAKKYADYNWAKGMLWSRLVGALLRHVFAFMSGEDIDKESGKSHLAHAGCCMLMLMETTRLYPDKDDRLVKFLENNKENK